MKRTLILAMAVLSASSMPAFAADEVEITVVGFIRPASCAMSVGNGGRFHHGEINSYLLKEGGLAAQRLEPLPTPFAIECSSPARWALKATDNRGETARVDTPWTFGIGTAANGVKIGSYVIDIADAVADGEAVVGVESIDGGATWGTRASSVNGRLPSDGGVVGFNVSSATAQGSKPIQSFAGTMKVQTTLAQATDFDLSEDIELDGSSTIQIYML